MQDTLGNIRVAMRTWAWNFTEVVLTGVIFIHIVDGVAVDKSADMY